MPERQSMHPDNDLIDEMKDKAIGGQHSRSGGELSRDVGTRAELNNALADKPNMERVVGSDNPEQDARKGPKTQKAIDKKNR